MHALPNYWSDTNHFIQWLTIKTKIEVQGLTELNPQGWYLIVCNHQSWADILILQNIFKHKIPMTKFFLKKELLWSLPFASWSCWLLDFPFMHRYSKSFLAKHPELKGKDIESTKKACEKFKNIPTTIISFVEGTRFSEEKKQRQQSPYQYLLRPKATTIAFALTAMGKYFQHILDVTIIYPNQKFTAWDFVCGRINKIIINIRLLPITQDLLGDFENDRNYRVYFQHWLNRLWQQKDELILQYLDNKKS